MRGERVVASANFLIDAESKVQGAVTTFEGPATGALRKTPLPQEAAALYQPVIAAYLNVQKSLVQDHLEGLPPLVAQLRAKVRVIAKSGVKPVEGADDYESHVGAIVVTLDQFRTGTLEEARVSFGKVSAALIAVLNEFPPPLKSAVYVLNCPMWDKSAADWIQTTAVVENPFMGQKMAGCGNVVKTIAGGK